MTRIRSVGWCTIVVLLTNFAGCASEKPTPSDCPTQRPADGATCTHEGLNCPYSWPDLDEPINCPGALYYANAQCNGGKYEVRTCLNCSDWLCSPECVVEGPCAHSECTAGEALGGCCSSCASMVCGTFPDCCTTSWSSVCVSMAQTMCGASFCGGA